jgi:hypothetical protein
LAIMQDFDMTTEDLTGIVAAPLAPTAYTLANSVQDNDTDMVQVYVNGVKVKCTAVSGTSATVQADYAIDASDVVTFWYQKA